MTKKKQNPKPRGGARAGSGRKTLGTIQVTIRMRPETAQALKTAAKTQGMTPGELLDKEYGTKTL